MTVVFWVAVLAVLYTYVGYPLILWLGGRLFGRRPRQQDITPKVTLLIAAYNEQDVIADKLRNSLALDYPRERLEILVASDSTDQTNSVVTSFASQGVRLLSSLSRSGKSAMVYAAVPQATGEVIVFSDANAFYQPDALRKLVRNFADARVGCVAGHRLYESLPGSGRIESLFVRYNCWVRSLESRFFSQPGADGAIFAIRKSLYFPLSQGRGDDLEIPVGVILHGSGAIFEPDAISRERGAPTIGIEFRRRIRVVSWNFTSVSLLLGRALAHEKWFLAWQLVSHKLLPWLMLVSMLAALIASAELPGSFYRAVLLLQALFYTTALVAWRLDSHVTQVPVLLLFPYYWCAMHLATFVGFLRSLNGPSVHAWEKVR